MSATVAPRSDRRVHSELPVGESFGRSPGRVFRWIRTGATCPTAPRSREVDEVRSRAEQTSWDGKT